VKAAILALLLLLPATAAAQQRTIYDPHTGKAVGTATTDTQGTTTYYDASGRATARISGPTRDRAPARASRPTAR
jgi:hypothetical protein